MTAERHVDERIDLWLDGLLDETEAAEVDAHLAECSRCRRLARGLETTRDALRESLSTDPAPAGLRANILGALDAVDAEAMEGSAVADEPVAQLPVTTDTGWGGARLALAAALAATLGALLWWGIRPEVDAPAEEVAEHVPVTVEEVDLVDLIHRGSVELAADQLPVHVAATDAATIEARWEAGGVTFPVRVLDLSAMGVEVVGGDAAVLDGQVAARSVYRDGDRLLICWMLALEADALGPAERTVEHGGFTFHVYSRDGRTLVFWEEGDVLCGLVGEGDPEAVLGLAQAKAMAPVVDAV